MLASTIGRFLFSAVLTSLDLNYNYVGPEGAKALANGNALRVNAVLTKLNVQYNYNLEHKDKKALQEAAEGREGFDLII